MPSLLRLVAPALCRAACATRRLRASRWCRRRAPTSRGGPTRRRCSNAATCARPSAASQALKGVTLDGRAGRDPRPRRPERLGQIDPDQRHHRPFPARSRHASLFEGTPIAALPAHRSRAPRHRPLLSDPAAVQPSDRARQCCARRALRRRPSARREARREATHWLGYTGLARNAFDLPQQLNLHERKFLELARALAARPRAAAARRGDVGPQQRPRSTARCASSATSAMRGTSIIFVEHLMRAVVALSDRVAVLNEGALIAHRHAGRRRCATAEVINVYLGNAHAS